jgi:hypothetical protein
VSIKTHYEGGSVRPTEFTVNFRIDGGPDKTRVFSNSAPKSPSQP